MAPIRTALIGLSTTSDLTNWAAHAHLPYLKQSTKYKITALCNSSVDKARASIKHYDLPETTKSYGSAEDVANDPDIDLVVCVVAVEQHYELLLPSIKAGKNIYTELPLAVDIDKCRHLAQLADQHNIRTMIGMQGQAVPAVNTIKKAVIEKLGKVTTCTVNAYAGFFSGDPFPQSFGRMVNLQGANMLTVWFLHTFNNVLHVLGEFDSFDSMLGITHPKLDVFDPNAEEKKTIDTLNVTAPDQVFFQGKTQSGALLTYHLEGGRPFPGEPGLRWHIVGEKGELMITSPMAPIDIGSDGIKILFHEYAAEKKYLHPMRHPAPPAPVEIELLEDKLSDVPNPARNVGHLYEAFADGRTEAYADWKVGLKRHELMEEMVQRWKGSQPHGRKAEYLERSC